MSKSVINIDLRHQNPCSFHKSQLFENKYISVGPCNGSPLQCFKTYFSVVNPAGNLNVKRSVNNREMDQFLQNIILP